MDLRALGDLIAQAPREEDEPGGPQVAAKSRDRVVSLAQTVKASSDAAAATREEQEEQPSGKGTAKAGREDQIWDDAEIATPHDTALRQGGDGRRQPEYDIVYKQSVGSETVYFGMDDVDPSSSSCTELVLKVKLPGQRHRDLDLDVKRQSLLLSSPDFRLATYLPYPVDHESGSAKWIADQHTLCVTLPILQT